MLYSLLDKYYTDTWDLCASHNNGLLRRCMCKAKTEIPAKLVDLLESHWFHDAYLTCICVESVADGIICYVRMQKRSTSVMLSIHSVDLYEIAGRIVDSKAKFPLSYAQQNPIAQILDVWIELKEGLVIYILLDNKRYCVIRCREVHDVDSRAKYNIHLELTCNP